LLTPKRTLLLVIALAAGLAVADRICAFFGRTKNTNISSTSMKIRPVGPRTSNLALRTPSSQSRTSRPFGGSSGSTLLSRAWSSWAKTASTRGRPAGQGALRMQRGYGNFDATRERGGEATAIDGPDAES
jgi:hypothetical protein